MIFIKEVLREIRKEVHEKYTQMYEESLKVEPYVLYRLLQKELKHTNMAMQKDGTTFTYIPTSGCAYCNKDAIRGCSFCNYLNENTVLMVSLRALQKRAPHLYSQLVIESCLNQPVIKSPMAHFLSGFDSLNEDEIDSKTWDVILEGVGGRRDKAMYGVLVTRADTITREKLKKWKGKVSRRTIVEIGVEVSHDWLRNHWLNKCISQNSILHAIDEIHHTGFYAQADVLIGIPGLTQKQSKQLFVNTCGDLLKMGVDYVLCSPLVNKSATLQQYSFQYLRENTELNQAMLINAITGVLPDIYTVFDAIFDTLQEFPELTKRLVIGPVHFPIYAEQMKNLGHRDLNLEYILKKLAVFQNTKDIRVLKEIMNRLSSDLSYKEFQRMREKEPGMNHWKSSVWQFGKVLAGSIWEQRQDEYLDALKKNLMY